MIETIVYVAIYCLVTIFVFSIIKMSVSEFTELKQHREMNETAVFIMERLTRDIKSGTQIDSANSTFDANPSRLTLNTITASGTPATVEYFVSGKTLYVKENGTNIGALMASSTNLDGIIFNYLRVGQVRGVKIDLHLSPAGDTTGDAEHYYDTALLRGTY